MDLSAAFDTVPHDGLLEVLNCKFRIEETALQWIENYLRPRFFKVCINKEYSDTKELTCSVPQGSASGANLFTCFASTLDEVLTDNIELELNGFADDHSVRKSFDAKSRMDEYTTIATIEKSMLKIKKWMDAVRLKMNESKTEFLLFGSRQHLKKCTTNSLKVLGENIEKSEVIRYLGRYLDSTLTFKQHIKTKCKSTMLNLLKNNLTHLDYANSLLIGLPDCSIKLMQKVQNMAAKVVLNLKKYDGSTEALKTLHWLPMKQQIEYKIINLTEQWIHGQAPNYLKKLLEMHKPHRTGLRSSSTAHKWDLKVKFTRKRTFADRPFAVAAQNYGTSYQHH